MLSSEYFLEIEENVTGLKSSAQTGRQKLAGVVGTEKCTYMSPFLSREPSYNIFPLLIHVVDDRPRDMKEMADDGVIVCCVGQLLVN